MNSVMLLYIVGRCAWRVGAWVAGVLYVPLLYCCGTAIRGGCGWVVGAFDFSPPLVLQRTKSKTHCYVSTCFILPFSCGYVLGAVSSVSVATRIAYHMCMYNCEIFRLLSNISLRTRTFSQSAK